ncbi:MAG TPA: GAF domain-containing protein [Anaerolineales bacterium]|nr:GAF domain-containing protein [Anaerolineales bacterium]
MKSKSIRTKLYLVTILALILTTLSISVVNIAKFQSAYRAALEQRSVTVAHNVRETVYKNLLFFPLDDFPGMFSYLGEVLKTNAGISYAYITDDLGQTLYESAAWEGENPLQIPYLQENSLSRQNTWADSDAAVTFSTGRFYESVIPIFQPGVPEPTLIGTVHIGVEKHVIDTVVSQMLLQSVAILALALLASSLLLYWLINRYIAAPLGSLTQAAHQFASGNLDQRVPVKREDEIGVLGHTFNQMAGQLRGLYDTLRISESHFRSLIENASDIITVLTPDGNVTYGSPSVERVLGYAPDDVIGHSIFPIIHPEDIPATQAILRTITRKTIQLPSDQRVEFRIRHHDKTWHVLEATSQQLVRDDGTVEVVVNSRDITERKRREREHEALIAVAASARAASNRASLLLLVLEEVMNVLDAEGAMLGVRDPITGETLIEQGLGEWISATGVRLETGAGISGWVLSTGQSYSNADIRTDERHISRELFSHLFAVACVPLIAQEQPNGVLWVGRTHPFAPADISLLSPIADIVANAIYRVSLFEQTEQRLHQLDALRKIDQAITASFDVQISLDVILDQVKSQLKADASDILLLNMSAQMLHYAAGYGFRSQAVQQTHLRIGEGHAGYIALERRPKYLPETHDAENSSRSPLLAGEGFIAYYGVPLVAKGRVKGVLEIFHRSPLKTNHDWVDFLETLAGQAAIAIDNAELFNDLQRSNLELSLAYDTTLEGWSRALDLRDRETEGHTQRVTELTERLARLVGIPDSELIHVRRGALLHDIGKMGIPDQILLKPGPLTDEEWVIMRRHPQYAYEMLSPIAFLRLAIDIPYCHHERWDGTGYPRRLKGEQIPLAARLFSVVDVWDALTSNRPYRSAWDKEKTGQYILNLSGKAFDPQVVEAFFRCLT